MTEITLSAVIREDRRLIIELPPDTPVGLVELSIRALGTASLPNSERNAAREQLLQAGLLRTDITAPAGTVDLTAQEILELGRLPEHAPSSHQTIDEDRGDY
jgi:hypothetical protein